MQLLINEFQLQGCECRLKDDPMELRRRLIQRIGEQFFQDGKLNRLCQGAVSISGRFQEIDEGNFALHFMCAFLGKPKVVCEVQVEVDDEVLWTERIEISTCGTCFHSMRALLNADIDLLAGNVLKRTIKALKNRPVIQAARDVVGALA